MDVIKELCARLPNNNARSVWEDFAMREYLSINMWQQASRVEDEENDMIDFTLHTGKPEWPGSFVVRTNFEATKVMDFYWQPQALLAQEKIDKAALLFDLTYTPDLAFRLKKPSKPLEYPDAGSW